VSRPLLVGIDLGIRTPHSAAIFDPVEGQVLGRRRRVVTGNAGLLELGRAAHELAGDRGVEFVIEPTGTAWRSAARVLRPYGPVLLAPTDALRGMSGLKAAYRKTDQVDAEALARLPLVTQRPLRAITQPPQALERMQTLLRRRTQIVRQSVDEMNMIGALAEQVWPNLPGVLGSGSGDEWAAWARSFLATYLDPRRVIAVGSRRLGAWLEKRGDRDAQRRAVDLVRAAGDAIASLPSDEVVTTLCEQVADDLRELDRTHKRVRALESRIRTIARSVPAIQVLQRIKGVGLVTACTFVAKIEDPRRFSSAKKLRSYCGLVPGRNQSGGRDPQGLRITKAGDRELRRVLYLAAWSARVHDPEMGAFTDRLDARGKHYTASTIAAAAKLAVRMRSLWLRFLNAGEDPAKVEWRSNVKVSGDGRRPREKPRSRPSGDASGNSKEATALKEILPEVLRGLKLGDQARVLDRASKLARPVVEGQRVIRKTSKKKVDDS